VGKFNQIAMSVGLGLFALVMLLTAIQKGMEIVLFYGLADCSLG
jgi:hypothetical protein